VRALVPLVTAALVLSAAGAAAATTTAAGPTRVQADVLIWAAGEPTPEGPLGAYAYDTELVPPGTKVALLSVSKGGRTTTLLAVRGLVPDRSYGAHLHVNACTVDPAAAGPHYQQVPDPVQPSTDPDYANPDNEVWLDFPTGDTGNGAVLAQNPWTYRQAPKSVVIHANATSHGEGTAGQAGPRVACLTLTARD